MIWNKHKQIFCEAGQFECSDGSCLQFFQLCDGISDCQDNEDERFVLFEFERKGQGK